MLLIKLFLVPIFIAVVTLTGRLWGAGVAGLLSGLPIIAGPILYFIYLENDLSFARDAATATVSGVIALSTFCFTYAWLCTRLNWQFSLLFSMVVYVVAVLLIGTLDLEINTGALVALAILLLQIYGAPKLAQARLIAPASNNEILCRMLFALLLVLGVTHFAHTLGATYSGIFAAFPIAGSTIALFSHRNYSAAHAIRSLKSMKQGLISMLAFFYIVAVVSAIYGFIIAFITAAGVAVVLQLAIVYLSRHYRNYTLRVAG